LVVNYKNNNKEIFFLELMIYGVCYDGALEKFLWPVFEELIIMGFDKTLYLRGKRLEYLPESIGNLKSIKILDLANNKLTYLPDFLKN